MVCHRDRSSSPDSPVRWYLIESDAPMADVTIELLRTHFRQLRLPTMGQEFERLARDAAATNQTFVQFLLGLTEIELETRAAKGVIAPVPGIMRLFWAFSPSTPPESPSQEDSSLANMLDTLEARCRSDGPPAGPRSIDPLPGSRSFLTVSAVA